jgi:hypothetical protein
VSYQRDACIPPERIREVLIRLKALRQVDENIYLRAGSLNVVNGLVGLNFSCDGTGRGIPLARHPFLVLAAPEQGSKRQNPLSAIQRH